MLLLIYLLFIFCVVLIDKQMELQFHTPDSALYILQIQMRIDGTSFHCGGSFRSPFSIKKKNTFQHFFPHCFFPLFIPSAWPQLVAAGSERLTRNFCTDFASPKGKAFFWGRGGVVGFECVRAQGQGAQLRDVLSVRHPFPSVILPSCLLFLRGRHRSIITRTVFHALEICCKEHWSI